MQVEFGKWGNSIALRIPAKVAKESGIIPGSQAEITIKNGALVIKPAANRITRKERLKRMIASLEETGPDSEIDWGRPVGNEIIEW